MRPVFYEIKRSISSKFSIVLIIAIIGLSALLSYEGGVLSTSHSFRGGNVSQVSGYYETGDNLTVVSYFYDQNGNPASSVIANASLNNETYSGVETAQGVFEFHMTTQSAVSVVNINYSYRLFGFRTNSAASVQINTVQSNYSGLDVVPGILNPTNSSDLGFMLYYVGPGGNHTSPPLNVYLGEFNTNNPSFNLSSFIDNSVWEHRYSYFNYLTIFPSLGGNAINKTYGVFVENATSVVPPIYSFHVIGPLSAYKPYTANSIETAFFTIEGSLLIIFIPLLSVFMAYFTYGKDRVTGVLESVLKRPITKGGAIRSRFFANSIVVAASIVAAIVVSDLISYRYFHVFMPLSFLMYISWAYSIVGISFLAISYLFAHILKSQGGLLGTLIAVFMIFGLFWNVIFEVLVSVFAISSGSSAYVSFQVAFYYANPAGYASLIQLYLMHTLSGFSSFGGSSQTINPLTYGVTPLFLLITAILWVAVPFLIAHRLATKRD